MTLTRRIYDAVAAMQPATFGPIADAVAASGASRRSVATSLHHMQGRGWITSTGKHGQLLYRTGTGAAANLGPRRRYAAPGPTKGRAPATSIEPTPALQPIWPAVAGAPIGGLSPCIG